MKTHLIKPILAIVGLFTSLATMTSAALGAHPSEGFETKSLPSKYGAPNYGTPPEWGFDDIQFTRPYPDPKSLDHAERYMLVGLKNFSGEFGWAAWFDDVMSVVCSYYSKHKSIPAVLDLEAIDSVVTLARDNADPAHPWLKSPIHGGFPRLDAQSFSPGDLYIRVLSDSEIERFCQVDQNLDAICHHGEAINPTTGDRWSAHLWSPVMYVRMYGRNGVILSRIYYTFGKNKWCPGSSGRRTEEDGALRYTVHTTMKCTYALSAPALFTLLSGALLLSACPLISPDAQKRMSESAKVPGLEEAVLAKDKAIKAAIQLSWASDVELMQEQLAVEDVRAGKVRITGIVSRPELKERAEQIARDMEGVADVLSTITVDESLKDKRLSLDSM